MYQYIHIMILYILWAAQKNLVWISINLYTYYCDIHNDVHHIVDHNVHHDVHHNGYQRRLLADSTISYRSWHEIYRLGVILFTELLPRCFSRSLSWHPSPYHRLENKNMYSLVLYTDVLLYIYIYIYLYIYREREREIEKLKIYKWNKFKVN